MNPKKNTPKETKTDTAVNEAIANFIKTDEQNKQEAQTESFVKNDDYKVITAITRIAYSHYLRSLRHAELKNKPAEPENINENFINGNTDWF